MFGSPRSLCVLSDVNTLGIQTGAYVNVCVFIINILMDVARLLQLINQRWCMNFNQTFNQSPLLTSERTPCVLWLYDFCEF